jgi:hypothetical protein
VHGHGFREHGRSLSFVVPVTWRAPDAACDERQRGDAASASRSVGSSASRAK